MPSQSVDVGTQNCCEEPLHAWGARSGMETSSLGLGMSRTWALTRSFDVSARPHRTEVSA